MPFNLKNVGATYQRLMHSVLTHQIGWNLEVYVDDMIVKTIEGRNYEEDLEDVLQSVRKYDKHKIFIIEFLPWFVLSR